MKGPGATCGAKLVSKSGQNQRCSPLSSRLCETVPVRSNTSNCNQALKCFSPVCQSGPWVVFPMRVINKIPNQEEHYLKRVCASKEYVIIR